MEDPRSFATPGDAEATASALYALAGDSLGAATSQAAAACDREIAARLGALLAPGAGERLASLFAGAPSQSIYRHLWRALATVERERGSLRRTFAMPIVVVAAADATQRVATTLSGVVGDVDALVCVLQDHRALSGNTSIALANTLASADALSHAQLGRLLAWSDDHDGVEPLPPASISIHGTVESVHLRFMLGTAIAAPGADLFREREPGRWGVPFAQALSRMLAAPGLSLLALPRAPMPLVEAAWHGYVARREVGAQVFASNAIRAIRARVGEPSAVISIHRSDTDPRGGEVRLSLSSPLDPRAAEGFRCPLAPLDRVEDVVVMLETLLADCRVSDVRRMRGVHGDRDPVTGQPLLIKADAANLPH